MGLVRGRLEGRRGSRAIIIVLRRYARDDVVQLNRPWRFVSLHESRRLRVQLDVERLVPVVHNRPARVHWLVGSNFVHQNRHDSLSLRLSLGDAAHLRDFHSRRLRLVANFVPPGRKNQAQLGSLDDATVLRVAMDLHRELLRRAVQDFHDEALDEDLRGEIGNHRPDADTLTYKKLLERNFKRLKRHSSMRSKQTHVGERWNSITDHIEAAGGENVLIQLLLSVRVLELDEHAAGQVRRHDDTRHVESLPLRQHVMVRPLFEIDQVGLLDRCLYCCHNLL